MIHRQFVHGTRNLAVGLAILWTGANFMTMARPVHAASSPMQATLLEADRAFAAMAMASGPGPAFAHYAEPEVTMFNMAEPKMKAPDLLQLFSRGLVIEWAPEDGAVAADGSLGYTWGKARYYRKQQDGSLEELPPTRYVTIWRRQADGSWKFLADGAANS